MEKPSQSTSAREMLNAVCLLTQILTSWLLITLKFNALKLEQLWTALTVFDTPETHPARSPLVGNMRRYEQAIQLERSSLRLSQAKT